MSDLFTPLPQHEEAEMPAPAADDSTQSVGPELRRKIDAEILDVAGVEGWAPVGDCLVVYVHDEGVAAKLPDRVADLRVEPVVRGEIRAF